MQANLAKFTESNAQVVGVCTDTVFSHIAFQKSLGGQDYPLLTDRWPYAETARSYGVFPAAKHLVPFLNDRAVFIVGEDGKIAWSKVYELGQLPDVSEILEALKAVKS